MATRFDRSIGERPEDEGLRAQAEAALRAGQPVMAPLPQDIPKLMHELQVHHVELEMQNDELRQAQQTLAEACDHYTQLYDFSPAGYVTLTPDGVITEANLRFCTMIGVHRKAVLQQPFQSFVVPQDWNVFLRHCLEVVASGTMHTCRLSVLPKDGPPLIMQMQSMSIKNTEGHGVQIETAMLDMTHREEAEIAVRESQRKVQEIAARLSTAQDDERHRIARDLHDDYCQRLTVAILELGMLPKRYPGPWASPAQHLQSVKDVLSGLLSDLRDLSHDLHPYQIASVTLNDALRHLLADFTKQSYVATDLHATPESIRLPQEISNALYRIVQECLANVLKHAKAERVRVTVAGLPDAVDLLITDDGQGFVPEAVDGSHHLGLISMRERAEQLRGKLTVTSRPGGGTLISVRIPLSPV